MIAHKNVIKNLGRILFWFPLRWTVQTVQIPLIYSIGGFLGKLDYRISGSRRIRRMSENIISALGVCKADALRIVRQNLATHMRNNLELMKYPAFHMEEIDSYVIFEHKERLDNALAGGKGVILITGHFGAKQLLQVALGLKGYILNQIYYHMSSKELSYIQKRISQRQRMAIEARLPVNFISAKGFLRSAFKCLQNNEVLIIAGDGTGLKNHMDKSYRTFDFLGKKMLFPTNTVSMAARTGASLIPVFAVREKVKHRIIFEPSIKVVKGEETAAVKDYIRVIEKYIRRYPSSWEFWEEFEEGFLRTHLS